MAPKAQHSAHVEERPDKQARLSAISQQLGDEFDEKHEDEIGQFTFKPEELEMLEDYDIDLYGFEDEDDEACDLSST